MNNKRGLWFGEETGKIVLAVIGVVLMIILMFKLIGLLTQKTEYEQAKIAMKEIEDTINSLGEGEVGYAFIESPRGWIISSYYKKDNTYKKPQSCGQNNCLCICPNPHKGFVRELIEFAPWYERIREECDRLGVCRNFENEITIGSSCFSNTISCRIIERVPFLFEIKKARNGNVLVYGEKTSAASEILEGVLANSTNVKIIKEWVFSNPIEELIINRERKIKTIFEEEIKKYEKKENRKIEKWYLTIGIVSLNGYSISYYRWSSETSFGDWACFKSFRMSMSNLLNPLIQPVYIAKHFYKEVDDSYHKSPSQYCFGGEWITLFYYVKEGNNRKDIVIEFRADEKN